MVQFLWLTCCFLSYGFVVRAFGYEGFVLVAPVDATRVTLIVLALAGLSFLLPRRLMNPADYVVVALFDISFVPFCAYWTLSSQPWWQWLLVTGYWALVLFISRVPLHFATIQLKGVRRMTFLVARGLVVLGAILILAGGHLTLQLPLGDVYAVRAVWATEGSGMSMYLFPWLAHVLLPLLLAHAWEKRRFGELLVLGFTAYMLFTSTGMKAYLIMPVLVVGVLVIAKWQPSSSLMPFGLSAFAGLMIILDKITRSLVWTSLGLRRAVFVPARLTSVYLEFFASNPTIQLSDSILLRGWTQYPYSTSVAHVIGTYLGQPSMGANNGLVADGFANFGVFGVFIWAMLLGFLLNLLHGTAESSEGSAEVWAVATMWPVVLLSSALTTSLLTHGLALGLLVIWSLKSQKSGGRSQQGDAKMLAAEMPSGGAVPEQKGQFPVSMPAAAGIPRDHEGHSAPQDTGEQGGA